MEIKYVQICCVALLLAFFTSDIAGDACGGLLESDGGEFDLPRGYNANGDLECVWVIQLLSRQTVSFKLNRLDSSAASVSLYPEHDASETVLNPVRLSASDVGRTFQSSGQTLVVILTRSDYSTGLSFTWDSLSSAPSDVLTAVNYIDADKGRVLWNRFSRRERLTWALNLESAQSLALEAATEFQRCELVNPCECSYFGLYEVTNSGYLREVTRVCGHSSNFETDQLYPKLLAFVYINSTTAVDSADHVELSWTNGPVSTGQPEPSTTTDWPIVTTTTIADTTIESTTEGGPSVIELDCGGIIDLPDGYHATVQVSYKAYELYNNNEACLWTFNNEMYDGVGKYALHLSLEIVSHGFEECCDGISALSWNKEAGMSSTILQAGTEYSFVSVEGLYLSFSSNSVNQGTGFIIQITMEAKDPVGLLGVNWFFSTVAGSKNYGPYKNNDRFSLVVNPKSNTSISLGLDYLITESCTSCDCDYLEIYDIGPGGNFAKRARLCGVHETPTARFTTDFPILLLLASDGSSTGSGFQVSWNN